MQEEKGILSIAANVFKNLRRGKVEDPQTTSQKIINGMWDSIERQERKRKDAMHRFSNEQLQQIMESANKEGKRYARNEMQRRAKK